MLWLESHILVKVYIVCRQFTRGNWARRKTRKFSKKKVTSSKEVIKMIIGLTGDDYMHMYSHF